MRLNLNPADRKLLEEVGDPVLLGEKMGALNVTKVAEGAHALANVYQEITHRGRFTGAAGFDKNFFFQHVASIPQSIIAALVIVDPEILTDKQKFYAYLAGPGKPWDVRRRVVKGAM